MPMGQKYLRFYLRCSQTSFSLCLCLPWLWKWSSDVMWDIWFVAVILLLFIILLLSLSQNRAEKRSSTNACPLSQGKNFLKFWGFFSFSLYVVEQSAPVHFWLALKRTCYGPSLFMLCTLCSILLPPENLLYGRGTQIL